MIFFAPAVKIQGLKTKVKNKRLEWLEVNVVAGKETVAKKYRVKPLDGDCDALKYYYYYYYYYRVFVVIIKPVILSLSFNAMLTSATWLQWQPKSDNNKMTMGY